MLNLNTTSATAQCKFSHGCTLRRPVAYHCTVSSSARCCTILSQPVISVTHLHTTESEVVRACMEEEQEGYK